VVVRRALSLGAAAVVAVFGVDALADATQSRPDPAAAADATEIVLDVRTRDDYSPALAAQGLVAACRQTVRTARVVAPLQRKDERHFAVVLQPALGPHARRRLFGCLQDATIDDAMATVVTHGGIGNVARGR
jgi:hypothetical protein